MVAMVAVLIVTAGITMYDGSGRKSPHFVHLTPRERVPEEERIDWISNGERVEITDHLEAGKLTVIEFTADW
jgi:hypothetical protein